MQILFTDETNLIESSEGKFFIFGGIVVDSEKVAVINDGIQHIREKYGFSDNDILKFETRSKPSQVSMEDFNDAKSEVVNLCVENGVLFLCYLIHHKIIKKELKFESAINHITSGFNKYLLEKNDVGICIYDRMPDISSQFSLLKDNFMTGLSLPDKKIKMDRIKLHAISSVGTSHLMSATDIILGSFRYCINNPKNRSLAALFINKISRLVWGERRDGHIYCIGAGIILRPRASNVYQTDYKELIDDINLLLKD